MNQILRILTIRFLYGKTNIIYKILYLRTNYSGYDLQNGDALDEEIFNHFNSKNPQQIFWELISIHDPNVDLSQYLNGFSPLNIPLIISPRIDTSLSIYELDNLANRNTQFPIQNRSVTLYHRSNIDKNHENWIYIPSDIRIDLDNNIYLILSQTIFPYLN